MTPAASVSHHAGSAAALACKVLGAATILAALVPVLLMIALALGWRHRLALLPLIIYRFSSLDTEIGGLRGDCTWAERPLQRLLELDVPVDACTIFVEDAAAFTPFPSRLKPARRFRPFTSRAAQERELRSIGVAAQAAAAAATDVVNAQRGARPKRRTRTVTMAAKGTKLAAASSAATPAATVAGAPAVAAAASQAAAAAAHRALHTDAASGAAPAEAGGEPMALSASSPAALDRDLLARARGVTLHVTRAGKRRYGVRVVVHSPAMRFVSYDHLFRDTNVRRLLAVLAPGDLAATSTAPAPPPPPPPARGAARRAPRGAPRGADADVESESGGLAAEAAALVAVDSIEVHRGRLEIVLNLSPVPTGGVHVLPPLTTLAETMALAPTAAAEGVGPAVALSVALLLKLNALAFRALASSSVDAVSSSLVAATAAAAAVLGRSLQVVDTVNGPLLKLGVPGAELLRGATGAGKILVESAVAGTGALLGGSVEATKLLAAALSSGSVGEMAKGIDRGARVFTAGVEGTVGVLASGLATSLSTALGGVDLLADRLGPARLIVRGMTDSARHVSGGVGSATASLVGSVLDSSTQLLADSVSSGWRAGHGLVTLDVDEVLAGSGQLLNGLARGVGTLGSGLAQSVGSVGTGAIRGVESATSGAARAGGEIIHGVAGTGARAGCFWLRPFSFFKQRGDAAKARRAAEIARRAAAAAAVAIEERSDAAWSGAAEPTPASPPPGEARDGAEGHARPGKR
jgi:hypothetical protein